MSDLSNEKLIIDDNNAYSIPGVFDHHRGLIPRDFQSFPRGHYPALKALDFQTIPMSDWPELIREKEAKKSRLSDIILTGDAGQRIKCLDQNGQGYCWMYAPVQALIAMRAVANMPYVRLSAHAGACKVKNFRDEGGWSALGLQWLWENGVPDVQHWKEQSMDRRYDTVATWENAKLYMPTEAWVDLEAPIYNRDLSIEQQGTCLLLNIALSDDYNWWGHAVMMCDLVDARPNLSATNPMRYGKRGFNSWGDSYGDRGFFVLVDSRAWADNSIALRVPKVS